jgi:hypothetical protein
MLDIGIELASGASLLAELRFEKLEKLLKVHFLHSAIKFFLISGA